MQLPKLVFQLPYLSNTDHQADAVAPRTHREGRVTLFLRPGLAKERRLNLRDFGKIEGFLKEPEHHSLSNEMSQALKKKTEWRYLFPPEAQGDQPELLRWDPREFNTALTKTLGR